MDVYLLYLQLTVHRTVIISIQFNHTNSFQLNEWGWMDALHWPCRDFNHSLLHSCGWMKKVNWFRHTSFISSIHHSISFNSTPWIDWNENEWSHSLRRPFELVSLAAVAPIHSQLIQHFISRSMLHSQFISWRTNAEDTSIAAALPFVCFPFIQLLSFQSIKLHTAYSKPSN